MTKDMTTGSPMKLVLSFAIPLMFGNLFQQFYSMVDTIIVGRFLGTGPLAAVGSTGSINFLILGFCTGICAGFTIPVSQSYGAKDFQDLKRFVGNILWLASGFTLVITVLTVALCRPILQWMDTPADILDDAYSYCAVQRAGKPAAGPGGQPHAGDFPGGRLPAEHRPRPVLDCGHPHGRGGGGLGHGDFPGHLRPGVPGVHLEEVSPAPHLPGRPCVPQGLRPPPAGHGHPHGPAELHHSHWQHFAANFRQRPGLGGGGLGVAMSTYGGQNIGARRGDRIFAGLRAGMIIGSVYSLFSLVVVVFFGKPMTLLFVDASETVIIDQAYQFMVIQVAFFIPLTAVNVIRLLIQGMGYSKLAVFAGVFEMIARGGFGLFLVPVFGFNMACFASPAAWILADCFLIPAYRKVMRHVRQYGQ